jgi:hypothetical protein
MRQQDPVLVRSRLIELSREFGQARWAILGEGNASGRIDQKVFAVKSSGSSLGALTGIEKTFQNRKSKRSYSPPGFDPPR